MSAATEGFVRTAAGVEVALADFEVTLLENLITDLRHLLMAEDHDMLRRLHPPAHPGDEDAEAAYREMIDDDLLRARLEGLDVVESTMRGGVLDDDGVTAWMQALNNLRLILGERLQTEGVDLESHDLPDDQTSAIYEWSGYALERLVAAAMPGLRGGPGA